MDTFLTLINDQLMLKDDPDRSRGAAVLLADLLRPNNPRGKELAKEHRNPTRASLSRYEGMIDSPWDEIAIQYVLVCNHLIKNRNHEAFKEQNKLVSLFLRYFQTQTGWVLLTLFCVLRDLRELACYADLELDRTGQKTDCQEEAARIIGSKAFSACMTDRASPYEISRKWGAYYVVSLALKSYFRVKRISLSKNILRALHSDRTVPPLEQFPKSHQVTYRYYIGMLSFLNEDYGKAEQELTLAFYQCHNKAVSNRQRILTYLIPLRIFRGHLPTLDLLSRFPALDNLFSPFIHALKIGNLREYDAALEAAEKKLVDLSLYFVLERSREMCLRGLFRKVWLVSGKSTRIHLEWFHAALRMSGMTRPVLTNPQDENENGDISVTREEAECMVANMIYKGYVKGYISHEKQMVVLGKNAFPRLADRPEPYSFSI